MTSDVKTVEGTWEYMTYAPKGQRCSACMKPIERFDLTRRGQIERVSGPPVVIYRHADKCPK
ncbi:hypothetical protein ACFY12_02440 [Streptomyces sp. NPDC001339]|uniref:hypothetical protein n=1 Tax=Streptomyces sp. NPDC001339 TaxID=3364563 RepID=UPI003692F9F1